MRLELRAHEGTTQFRYDIAHASHPTGPQDYLVSMDTTPCRFGGRRWWWVCPVTQQRVAKLYLPNGGYQFLSRGLGAYRLAYGSQRQGLIDRTHARSRKLYARLGADYGRNYGGWPPKPKGMHWRTYDAICARLEAEGARLDMGLLRATERSLGRDAFARMIGAEGSTRGGAPAT